MTENKKVRIYKKFLFSPKNLYKYISSKKGTFNTIQHEILSALTIAIVYKNEIPGNYYIYFPIKSKCLTQHELEKNNSIDYDIFFKDYLDTTSLTDVYLVRMEDYGITPLQFKRFDAGKKDHNLVDFLRKYKNISNNKNRLIIIYENILGVQSNTKIVLEEVEVFFKNNFFPFPEIVLIHLVNNKNRDVEFYQFWPLMKGFARYKKFSMHEIEILSS